MASTEGMADLRAVLDRRRHERGWSIQRLASEAGFTSTQALQQKMSGKHKFSPLELGWLAEALDLDVVSMILTYWPELAAIDRLHELRILLADVSDVELSAVVVLVRAHLESVPPGSEPGVSRPRSGGRTRRAQ